MSFVDRNITCRYCGTSFVFTAGEQAFYQQKGFQNEPTRCPSCRRQKKDSGGGRGGDMGTRAGGSSRQMYKAVCSACGMETQVPFAPSGDRPVYCRTCYNSRRGAM
jgi:CxxC-x17-CxxC domain-containing protein